MMIAEPDPQEAGPCACSLPRCSFLRVFAEADAATYAGLVIDCHGHDTTEPANPRRPARLAAAGPMP